ncbi:hypothetical protein BN948_01907 [Hydrogenophaga intermedia]|uniref:Uncharacterized protein n=1 Tax=Hydrogenophaga intermedia TaxID=65786 RepID=A0A1L1PQ81_HYDIT|nr:hypothetical protein BN948_01907 [Hydrogenophaga intermedia]
MVRVSPVYIVGAGAVLLALVWAMTREGGARGVGASLGEAAVDFIDGTASGAVVGIGELVGIPATNKTQCQLDREAGNTWAASFSCPAKDFLNYLWS